MTEQSHSSEVVVDMAYAVESEYSFGMRKKKKDKDAYTQCCVAVEVAEGMDVDLSMMD